MSTTAQKNGVAPTSESKNGAGLHTVKPQDKATTTPLVALPTPSITVLTQREKAEKLNILFEKEEKLTTTRKSLERFKLATDESTNELELTDGKGAGFRTHNPTLIKSVIDLVMSEITAKQAIISSEIIAVG